MTPPFPSIRKERAPAPLRVLFSQARRKAGVLRMTPVEAIFQERNSVRLSQEASRRRRWRVWRERSERKERALALSTVVVTVPLPSLRSRAPESLTSSPRG